MPILPLPARRQAYRRGRLLGTASWLVLALCAPALAGPEDGTVTAGVGTITQADRLTTIDQASQRLVVDWRSFDVAADEKVKFNQPGRAATALNRIRSHDPSTIAGQIEANGNVIIVNPNGVMFTQSARVDVGGLVASTADIDNAAFMNGSNHFDKPSPAGGKVSNAGHITAREAGLVGLVAPEVENSGTITARLGRVALAAGETATVDLSGDGLIQVGVSDTVTRQLVRNSGTITAEGGTIALTAAAGRQVVDSLIDHSGSLQAQSAELVGGKVIIRAEGESGRVVVTGEIDARGNKGGKVQVLAKSVTLKSGATIDASGQTGGGEVLIGGDYLGGNPDILNAWRTIVEPNVRVRADALEQGQGGRIIFWADDATFFWGEASVTGGAQGGDGGFVEVSGKRYLLYRGFVDTRAALGETGLLLLDPADIVIASGSGDGAADGTNTFRGAPSNTVGTVLGPDTGPSTIYESELEGIAAATNIALTATNSITINNLADNNLSFAQNAGRSVSMTAGAGGIVMSDTNDTITTAGGALNFTTSASGAVTLGNLATNGGLITMNVAGNSTISGVISGTATALTKVTGSGTLTLSGTNTYTGNTTITNGTVIAANNAAFGTGTVVMNGGTLQSSGSHTFSNSFTISNNSVFSGSGAIILTGILTNSGGNRTLTVSNSALTTFNQIRLSEGSSNRSLTIAGTGNFDVTGAISNGVSSTTSSFTKSNTGTATLYSASTLGGTFSLSGGITEIRNASALGAGSISLAGGTLRGDGSAYTITRPVNVTGNSSISGTSALTFSNSITNNGGSRTLTVSSTGLTTFNNVNLSNDGTARTFTLAGTGNIDVTGTIANGGGSTASSLTKSNTGTLTIYNASTIGGTTTLSGGITEIRNNGAFGAGTLALSGVTLRTDGSNFTLTNPVTLGGNSTITGSGAITFSNTVTQNNNRTLTNNSSALLTLGNVALANAATPYTLTLGGSGNIAVTGNITNGGTATGSALTKSGAGTLTLSGTNAYTGTTTVSAGVLRAVGASSLGAGTLTLTAGTLQLAGDTATSFGRNVASVGTGFTIVSDRVTAGAGVTHSLGTLAIGAITLNTLTGSNVSSGTAGVTFGATTISGNPTFSVGTDLTLGALSNGGSNRTITKSGAGDLVFSAAAGTWATTGNALIINQGTVRLGATNALGSTAATAVTVNSTVAGATALFDLSGFNQTVAALTFGGAGATATSTNNVSTGSGTLTLGGNVAYTSTNNPLGSTLAGNLALGGANRTFTVNDSGGATNDLTISAAISGTGDIIKAGAGRLVLAGTNSYTGATTVSAGQLRAGATEVIPDGSAMTVAASAAFELAGYTETLASLDNSGSVALGNGGSLTAATTLSGTGSWTGQDATLASSGGGNLTFTNTANDFTGTLAFNTTGDVSVVDANSLHLTTSTVNTLLARALAGNMTMSGSLAALATSGDAITLTASGNFSNSGSFSTAGSGRWLVYSTNPASDTLGGLSADFRRFSCTYGGSCPSLAAGNGLLYTLTPLLTATPTAITSLVYGDAAPSLAGYAYTLSGYLGSDATTDSLTGSLNGTSPYVVGNNAGNYAINYSTGTLTSALGYGFSYADNATGLQIGKKLLSATVGDKTITYGTLTPTLDKDSTSDVVWSGFYTGDDSTDISAVSFLYGGATPALGDDAGSYTLGVGSLSAANYALGTITTGTLLINPYTLAVTANAQTKIYGAADPTLTYSYGTLQNGDTDSVFTGALARAAGETVAGGPYAINLGTLSAGSNYTLSFTGANLAITPYTLAVTANAQTKIYGAADPTLTYAYGTLQNGDTDSVFSGALSRVAGETVGSYGILQGTLAAGSNYTLSFTADNLTITALASDPADVIPPAVDAVIAGSPIVPVVMSMAADPFTSLAPAGSFDEAAEEAQGPITVSLVQSEAGSTEATSEGEGAESGGGCSAKILSSGKIEGGGQDCWGM